MNIPGRRKKDGPGKTVIQLFLYYLLYTEDAFLCKKVQKRFQLSERTLFRYMEDLKVLFPEQRFRFSGKGERTEFTVYYELYGESPISIPEKPHLNHLSRLIRLDLLLDEDFYDEEEDPMSASEVRALAEKDGLIYPSLRMLQRDLKTLREAYALFTDFTADFF